MKKFNLEKAKAGGEMINLINGECLEEMKNIKSGSIDMVLYPTRAL